MNARWHKCRVLDHESLVRTLERLRDEGRTTNADLQKLLKLPSSRVSEIFGRTRAVKVDEMKLLVEHFDLESGTALPPLPSADTLEPILDALLPLAPPGRMTDQSRRALAEALSYGLELLGKSSAMQASAETLRVAANAAAARFREKALA